MKYLIFTIVALGVFPLGFLLSNNLRWAKGVFWGMVLSLCLFQATAINFFSRESYTGSARGMEVSLVYLLALALLVALLLRGKFRSFVQDTGFWIYVFYFLLCWPSLTAADNCLIAWFEIWKMIMMMLVFLAVYGYLKATNDLKTVLATLAFFAIVNFLVVAKQHYSGIYQPGGVFPHRNSMSMAMHLTGMLFFAFYLTNGISTWFRKFCMVAFVFSVASVFWSYSRGAMLMTPIGYAITGISCFLFGGHWGKKVKRLLPLVLLGLLGMVIIMPRIVERFVTAPQASTDTRVELAQCSLEMIKDEPLRGVGINNWGLKMIPPHEYQDRAGDVLGYDMDYHGIVETVYLLVAAECGIPALLAMLAWFGWYWWSCISLARKLNGTKWVFLPAGLLGGLTADYLQSTLEWVLRQQMNLICLVIVFAIISYLNTSWCKLKNLESA